jgi:hypothetical protein
MKLVTIIVIDYQTDQSLMMHWMISYIKVLLEMMAVVAVVAVVVIYHLLLA